jgi:hypothetical protein
MGIVKDGRFGMSLSLTFRRFACIICFFIALMPASAWAAGSSRTTVRPGSPARTPSWHAVPSPNGSSTGNNYLESVAAISTKDAWAVGYYSVGDTGFQTLTEHWNGTSWSVVASPNIGTLDYLSGVAAIATNDVWAVGYEGAPSQPLTEHWDGTQWSIVSSPNQGGNGELKSVVALSTSDVWAVGLYVNSSSLDQTLIEQWNGTSWSVVPSPNFGMSYDNLLNSVATDATGDLWAVGYTRNTDVDPNTYQTLAEQWNGTQWSIVTSPNVSGTTIDQLYGVTVASSSVAMAVGTYVDSTGQNQTLTEQWNGTNWAIVPSPNVNSSQDDELWGSVALSTSDIWAVGVYYNTSYEPQTLTEQWNGTSWAIVPSPNVGLDNILAGVAATPTGKLGAVGYSSTGINYTNTLIEFYS